MTNILTAAFISTNAILCGNSINDICWTNDPAWTKAFQVTQRCIMPREIYCPVCQNVTTQEVDVTDLDDHYRQLRSIDLRCNQDLVRMCLATTQKGSDQVKQIKAELEKAKAAIVAQGTSLGMSYYWDGYTNALIKAAAALRGTGHETLVSLFAPGERKLLLKIADSLEQAAALTAKEVSDDQVR